MSKTSERIKALRLQSGLSADELGRRIGKNRATVYRYESDDIENMPVSILQPLSDAPPHHARVPDGLDRRSLSAFFWFFHD